MKLFIAGSTAHISQYWLNITEPNLMFPDVILEADVDLLWCRDEIYLWCCVFVRWGQSICIATGRCHLITVSITPPGLGHIANHTHQD